MTIEDQLAHLDYLEARVATWSANAVAFASRSFEPQFVMVPAASVWDIPHPYEDYHPPEWDRVFFASIGAGVTIACFATVIALVKS